MRNALACARGAALILVLVLPALANAEPDHLAPGFTALPRSAKVVIMPADVELFSISAGGVLEPRADWTATAALNLQAALSGKRVASKLETAEIPESQADDFDEVNALHAAVAQAIALHHFGPGNFRLPTKESKLDWSLGEAVRPIRERTGADYALFTWLRDSYASGERVATMVVMALLGVGLVGGSQTGYASLVDLNTGQVVWFNRLLRASGDLREPAKAAETVDALLRQFPSAP